MAFSNELPSVVIPPRTEGGPEYPVDYDPADELSGMAPWDPNYVPPAPPPPPPEDPAVNSGTDTQGSVLNPFPAQPVYQQP